MTLLRDLFLLAISPLIAARFLCLVVVEHVHEVQRRRRIAAREREAA